MANDILKGDDFLNRYRLEGTLITKSPFHLGSGFTVYRDGLVNEKAGKEKAGKENEDKAKKKTEVSGIATDYKEKPVIPGSSFKGALRSFLYNVLAASHGVLGADRDFEDLKKKGKIFDKQDERIRFMKEKASVLERLFGTPFAEGKIDVWDGECIAEEIVPGSGVDNPGLPPYWSKERLTYVDRSVAINPETNVAIDKKLYHFEVVPPGISFRINISGQNLVPVEIGMILFGLEAFNSEIWPMTLGAMSGRGFGRFDFKLDKLYCLDETRLNDWIEEAVKSNHSGYFGLKQKEAEADKMIENFRNSFLSCIGGR